MKQNLKLYLFYRQFVLEINIFKIELVFIFIIFTWLYILIHKLKINLSDFINIKNIENKFNFKLFNLIK